MGGKEDDTFVFNGDAELPGSYNSIAGRAGFDTLDYSNYNSTVYVDLVDAVATSIKNGISSIENVIGSASGNEIYGDDNDNHIVGTSGNDLIYGRGGNDILEGRGGDDLLDGGTGIDTVDYSANLTDGVTV